MLMICFLALQMTHPAYPTYYLCTYFSMKVHFSSSTDKKKPQ